MGIIITKFQVSENNNQVNFFEYFCFLEKENHLRNAGKTRERNQLNRRVS